ncbi:hypothetical protein CsSME_00043659 [Camellia sinensis var. sinensis]
MADAQRVGLAERDIDQPLRKEHICLSMGAEGSQSSALFDFLLFFWLHCRMKLH